MKKIAGIFLVSCITLAIFSQTIDDLHNTYTNGAQALKEENYNEAIDIFSDCLDMCEKIGTEADNYITKIEAIYPNLFYSSGMALYKEKKMDEAIARFEEGINVAREYNDEKTIEKLEKVLSQLYSAQGSKMYQAADYDSSIHYFNKTLEIDTGYSKAYFGKGMSYKALDDFDNMKAAFEKLFEVADEGDKNAEKAKTILKLHYVNNGKKAINEENYEAAVENLTASLDYDDADMNIYFYIAYSDYKLEELDACIEICNKAIEKAGEGESEEIANIYYQLGEASRAIGDNATACDAYAKVTSGKYIERAKRQMDLINCP